MNDFTLFAETPCATLEKLRLKGVSKDSDYMQSLDAACKQKMQPDKVLTGNNNLIKIAGIGALVIGLGTAFFLIFKKL